MSDKESVNWVRRRHECSLDFVFGHLLYKQIEEDVREANELISTRRAQRFTVEKNKSIYVQRDRNTQYQVVVNLEDDAIRVSPYKDSAFFVTQRWDDETAESILCDDGTPVEPWQISRRALSALFFGD